MKKKIFGIPAILLVGGLAFIFRKKIIPVVKSLFDKVKTS